MYIDVDYRQLLVGTNFLYMGMGKFTRFNLKQGLNETQMCLSSSCKDHEATRYWKHSVLCIG